MKQDGKGYLTTMNQCIARYRADAGTENTEMGELTKSEQLENFSIRFAWLVYRGKEFMEAEKVLQKIRKAWDSRAKAKK